MTLHELQPMTSSSVSNLKRRLLHSREKEEEKVEDEVEDGEEEKEQETINTKRVIQRKQKRKHYQSQNIILSDFFFKSKK